jgi:outer membrane protein assembly factor BamB
MNDAIFCPDCNTLILDAPRCKCGWERPPAKASERGKLAWKISLARGEPSGLRLADGVLYFVDGAGNLRALEAGSGADKWPEPPSLGEWRAHNQVAVGGGLVVVGPVDYASIPSNDKAAMAFGLESGRERWRRPLHVRQISDPLIARNTVFVAASDGSGVALNLEDGSLRWRQPIGGIYFAAPALAADLVLFGSDKGILMARRGDDGCIGDNGGQQGCAAGRGVGYSGGVGDGDNRAGR